jgi:hypothetical protein
MRTMAVALGLWGLLGVAPAPAAVEPTVTRVYSAGATASGTAGDLTFGATIDAFARTEDGVAATNVGVDIFASSGLECTTLESDAEFTPPVELEGAAVTGTVTGECFDPVTQTISPFTATVDLTWTGTGEIRRTRFVSPPQGGNLCVTRGRTRTATVDGILSWEAPAFGLSATAQPDPEGPLRAATSFCVRTVPGGETG